MKNLRIKTFESVKNSVGVHKKVDKYWCKENTSSGWVLDKHLSKVYKAGVLNECINNNKFYNIQDVGEICYPHLEVIEEIYES